MNRPLQKFSDPIWLGQDGFSALVEISQLLESSEADGREALIRVLEYSDLLKEFTPVISSLIQKAGLYPYLKNSDSLTTSDLVNYEYHAVSGLDGVYLHSAQAKVYRTLMDGTNVILSAPTSFGKSLLIDAMIASKRFSQIVVIVPTIALIDETRRRLSERFSKEFKVITHASQEPEEHNIYILTQERFIEFQQEITPDFFIIDEFYKLSQHRGDERTFVLNHAFYKLFKSGAQFFLIGPNIEDIVVDEDQLNFRFFRFNFTTVATEIRYSEGASPEENALSICREVTDPTLVFCQSARSAYKLASLLIEKDIRRPTQGASDIATWLRQNYHEDWLLADLLDAGIAVHHGSLPRSIAYHILRKFNQGEIQFLFCTSTIIEGVNTSAKNIIIYDNKVATKKFDQFTFNNIKGRAGRMLKHFVGHVYVLHREPDPELPIVDIPSITQPDSAPDSLLIQLDHSDLSERSEEQLRYLHAQDYLPVEVIKENSGIDPRRQIELASEISGKLIYYHNLLKWKRIPNYDQLFEVCRIIHQFFLNGSRKDDISSGKQLAFLIYRFTKTKSIPKLIAAEIENDQYRATTTDAIEGTLKFLRQWCEFHFPRYLGALDSIQRSVFEKYNLEPGNYELFGAQVKHLFMHPSVTILEEYGLPYTITQKILQKYELGGEVDPLLDQLPTIDFSDLQLTPFEKDMLKDTLANL